MYDNRQARTLVVMPFKTDYSNEKEARNAWENGETFDVCDTRELITSVDVADTKTQVLIVHSAFNKICILNTCEARNKK